MLEAAEEFGSEEEEGDEAPTGSSEVVQEAMRDPLDPEGKGQDVSDADDHSGDEEEQVSASVRPPKRARVAPRSPGYLPDHFFTSALSETAKLASATGKDKKTSNPTADSQSKKRKRARKTGKDSIVGYVVTVALKLVELMYALQSAPNPNFAVRRASYTTDGTGPARWPHEVR